MPEIPMPTAIETAIPEVVPQTAVNLVQENDFSDLPLGNLLRAAERTTQRGEITIIYTELVRRYKESFSSDAATSLGQRKRMKDIAKALVTKRSIREGERRNLYNTILRLTESNR